MLLGEDAAGRDIGRRRLEFVFPARHNARLAVHQRLPSALRGIGRVALVKAPDNGRQKADRLQRGQSWLFPGRCTNPKRCHSFRLTKNGDRG